MSTAPIRNTVMDFETADAIVDRVAELLQEERRIGGRYIAQEWIGSWSLLEVTRALYLVLALRYREEFPSSQTSADFAQFATLVEGTVATMQGQVFPMVELATLERADDKSPEWWEASGELTEKALARMQRGVGTVPGFTAWLTSVNHPHFDDYLAMVNDRIDRHLVTG